MIIDFHKHLDFFSQKIIERKTTTDAGISHMTGCLGKIFFLCYFCEFDPENENIYKRIIKDELEIFYGQISNESFPPFYVNGLTGFGYTLAILFQKGIISEEDKDILDDVDEIIWDYCKVFIQNYNFDFFTGLIGIGNYYIIRHSDNKLIDKKLIEIAEVIVNNTIGMIEKSISKKEETIEFSLSHGIASIIVFIAKLIELGILDDSYKEDLKKICYFTLSFEKEQRLPDIIENGTLIFSGLRWCHGDLGIVYALAYASKIIEDSYINEKALSVAKNISNIKGCIENELFLANICHGTLGVAHIFKKMHLNFWQIEEIKEASEYWYEQSINIMNSKIEKFDFNHDFKGKEQFGILNGIEGIGLALMSAISKNKIDWDNSILLFDNQNN